MYNHQLDTFIKVADCGSFNKATKAMYISAPAIIQQINLLEESCGFQLFVRTSHGVKLTPAGQSLYKDAKDIILASNQALNKARKLAESSDTTVRIATSLLYKCRLLPSIWTKVQELYPSMKIEILSISAFQKQGESFSALGEQFDLFEGIYASSWDGLCQFLELERTPICCAVSKKHPYARRTQLSLQDLHNETIVMPMEGVSKELDHFRKLLKEHYHPARMINSARYDFDTFTLCEVNDYILITQPVYQDIHSNLITIPLETEQSLPYGLMYANEPTQAVKQFISAIRKITKKDSVQSPII